MGQKKNGEVDSQGKMEQRQRWRTQRGRENMKAPETPGAPTALQGLANPNCYKF